MPNPQPVRTDEFPAGLPAEDMSNTDAIKLEKGNIIANSCAEIGQYCVDKNKLLSIEKPTRSIIWEMIDMKKIMGNQQQRNSTSLLHVGKRQI